MIDNFDAVELQADEALITASEDTFLTCTPSNVLGRVFSLVFGLTCNFLCFGFSFVRCILDFLRIIALGVKVIATTS
jgi:hypothetical protein